jgi:hypothetical protein
MARSLLAALIGLCLASPAGAITVAPMDFVDLVQGSAAVVYARVKDVRGQWTADRQGIESLVTIDIISAFKGTPGPTLTLAMPGGQVGRFLNVLPGAPSFAPGDLVVLFLLDRGPRLPITTGFTQGIYRVTPDARSGAMVVVPPIVERAGATGRIVRGDPQRRPMGLPAFASAVLEAERR